MKPGDLRAMTVQKRSGRAAPAATTAPRKKEPAAKPKRATRSKAKPE